MSHEAHPFVSTVLEKLIWTSIENLNTVQTVKLFKTYHNSNVSVHHRQPVGSRRLQWVSGELQCTKFANERWSVDRQFKCLGKSKDKNM